MKGTVRKPRTPGGTWSYRIDLDARADGSRRQKQVGGFATKREAQAALNEALTAHQRGTYIAPSKQTVAEYLEAWLPAVQFEVAATAWTNYREIVGRYINPHLGQVRLAELTPMRVKAWHSALRSGGGAKGRPLSASSVQLAHRVLHRALADAVRWNVLLHNPASAARAPRAERPEMQAWTIEEATRFMGAVAGDRLEALWTVALHTGMRRGELAGLRWKDVDLNGSSLTVAQQRTASSYEVVVAPPKAKSHRQLVLAAPTVEALRRHRAQQRRERLAAGSLWTDSGYVFVDELGVPYHPQRLRTLFEKACNAVGVPAIRLHDLRHTMATLALQAGVHPKVVQEQLGHAGIDITLDIYSHVPQAVRRDAADLIAGLLSPPLSP